MTRPRPLKNSLRPISRTTTLKRSSKPAKVKRTELIYCGNTKPVSVYFLNNSPALHKASYTWTGTIRTTVCSSLLCCWSRCVPPAADSSHLAADSQVHTEINDSGCVLLRADFAVVADWSVLLWCPSPRFDSAHISPQSDNVRWLNGVLIKSRAVFEI